MNQLLIGHDDAVLGILVLSGLILLPVLIPLAGTDHGLKKASKSSADNNSANFTSLDKLAMGNIQEESPRLWAFLLGTYWVTFVTFYILWNAYKHASDLRAAAKAAPPAKPEYFSVLVRDIPTPPKGQSRKEQVDSYFKALHPDTFYKSMVVTDNKEVDKLLVVVSQFIGHMLVLCLHDQESEISEL